MGIPGIAIQPVDDGNYESAARFLIEWVSDGEAEARRYLADHAEPDGASLIATRGPDVIGYVAIVWESNYAGFRSRGIPLVHQIAVAGPFRRRGVAALLMDEWSCPPEFTYPGAASVPRTWAYHTSLSCGGVRMTFPRSASTRTEAAPHDADARPGMSWRPGVSAGPFLPPDRWAA